MYTHKGKQIEYKIVMYRQRLNFANSISSAMPAQKEIFIFKVVFMGIFSASLCYLMLIQEAAARALGKQQTRRISRINFN